MKLCLSQCCSIYLYIDNVRARKSLSEKWYGKKLRETPGFSRGGAVEIGFRIFAESLKIYGIVRVLVL